MPYTPNIPTATQFISSSQPLIQQNFQNINTLIDVNHYTFGTGATLEGKHKEVTFPVQAADQTTLAGEVALYSKTVVTPQLFYRPQSNGTPINISAAIASNTGETTLISGIKMKWGRGTTDASGVLTITFATAGLTAFTNIFSIQATAATTSAPGHDGDQIVARVDAYSATSFTVRTLRIQAAGGNPQTAPFTWFAIGN